MVFVMSNTSENPEVRKGLIASSPQLGKKRKRRVTLRFNKQKLLQRDGTSISTFNFTSVPFIFFIAVPIHNKVALAATALN